MNIGFSRRTDLALSALNALARADGRMSRARLASEIGTTAGFLPQVLAPLVQGGWVVSDRGPGGGYQLTPAAFDAKVLDVVEATEGPAEDGRCVLREAPCPGDQPCRIHAIWVEARQVLIDGFDGIPALHAASQGEMS